jgi:hypothetical protein
MLKIQQPILTIIKEKTPIQWLIAQLVERSVSLMKDPGSNLGMDIFFVIDL